MNQLALPFPADLTPTMAELGWTSSGRGRVYTHESGAVVEFEGAAYLGDRRARLNGGDWQEVREPFWVTVDRALSERAAA